MQFLEYFPLFFNETIHEENSIEINTLNGIINLPLELIELIYDKLDRKRLVEICMRIGHDNFLFDFNKKYMEKFRNNSGLYRLIEYDDIEGVKYLIKSRENIENVNNNISKQNKYDLIEKMCVNKQLEMIQLITDIDSFSVFNDIFHTFYVATVSGYLELSFWIVKELGKGSNPDWMIKICDSVIEKKDIIKNFVYNESYPALVPEKVDSEIKGNVSYKFTINGWPENIWITGEIFHTFSQVKSYIRYIDKVYVISDDGYILHFWPGDYLLSLFIENNMVTIKLPLFPYKISTERIVIIIEAKIPTDYLPENFPKNSIIKITNPFSLKISKIHTVNNACILYENYRSQKKEYNLYPIYSITDITRKFHKVLYLQYSQCEFDWISGPNIITEIIFMKPWPKIINFKINDLPLHFWYDKVMGNLVEKCSKKDDALIFPVIIFPNCVYTMNLEYSADYQNNVVVKGNIYAKYVNCLTSTDAHIFPRIFVSG